VDRFIAGPPVGDVVVPPEVAALAAGAPARCVWANQLGGLTFEIGDTFVKWAPPGGPVALLDEAERLQWAARFVAVPEVLDAGPTWIRTRRVPGTSAVDVEPSVAVCAIGEGLRMLHDTLPLDDCPFSWSVDSRLTRAVAPVTAVRPTIDRLVVCHGDACAPNTLVGDDGHCSGHVDFAHMGVADRWADIAIATWSTVWNYGEGWEDVLLAAYGIDPDPERTAYYRMLWDATD
jgi:kanamycin kinase